MITRRNLLKGMAAGLAGASVAALTLIRDKRDSLWSKAFYPDTPNVLESADHNVLSHLSLDHPDGCPYGCGVQYSGFGLARPKPEGGIYYVDPMDDPEYRGQHGQGGKYLYAADHAKSLGPRANGRRHQS